MVCGFLSTQVTGFRFPMLVEFELVFQGPQVRFRIAPVGGAKANFTLQYDGIWQIGSRIIGGCF